MLKQHRVIGLILGLATVVTGCGGGGGYTSVAAPLTSKEPVPASTLSPTPAPTPSAGSEKPEPAPAGDSSLEERLGQVYAASDLVDKLVTTNKAVDGNPGKLLIEKVNGIKSVLAQTEQAIHELESMPLGVKRQLAAIKINTGLGGLYLPLAKIQSVLPKTEHNRSLIQDISRTIDLLRISIDNEAK
jgi:hypothetical protein